MRIGYQPFTQKPGRELADFQRWNDIVRPDRGDARLKCVGAGEMLVASAHDFEDFSFPRPTLGPRMEGALEPVLDFLPANRWPFRFHCTYEESAQRILDVVERVGGRHGLDGLNWIFDHGETITPATMDRIARRGGGISYQNRIALQAREYERRYGTEALRAVMPVRAMMASGVPLAAGTDATRVSSCNPWLAIRWAVTGKGRGGDAIWSEGIPRHDTLRHWTVAGASFSREAGQKGAIAPGQMADLAVLDRDCFTLPEDGIAAITADLTLPGGQVVHAAGAFSDRAPPVLPAPPAWSPVPVFGGPGVRT